MIRRPYPLHQSPLYSLSNKRRLCELLSVPRAELSDLASDGNYRIWQKRMKGRQRTIEEPLGPLKRVHKQVQILLSRLEYPDWVYSGIRGRSYVGNAQRHTGERCLCSFDIQSFYQSSKKEYVFRFLRYLMRQSQDVSWVLADIATYKSHLPTGSPSSQLLAFWAYQPMFGALRDLAASVGGTFTLYVDDIAVSTEQPLPEKVVGELGRVVRGYGLRLKRSKTQRRNCSEWKVVTGGAISPEGTLTIPNRLRQRIHTKVVALKKGDLDESGLTSLRGLLTAARQLDPSFHESLYQYVCHLASRIEA